MYEGYKLNPPVDSVIHEYAAIVVISINNEGDGTTEMTKCNTELV